MHQTKKGQQWYFGMKAHVGTDLETGVVHKPGDHAGQRGRRHAGGWLAARRGDGRVRWTLATRVRRNGREPECAGTSPCAWASAEALDTGTEKGRLIDELERVKARIRAKGEHAFRVIKRQFGFTKVSYRGLAKNTAKLHTLFMLGSVDAAQTAAACEA